MAQNIDITTDELLKNKVITQSDLDEYKQTGSFSDTAKANSRAYYVNKKSTTQPSIIPTGDTANASTANAESPSSNMNNIIEGQNYTNTSTNTTPTGTPEVSTSTTSTTPGEASSGGQPDITGTALEGQKAVITSQQNDLVSDKNKTITDSAKDNEKYLADLQKAKDDQIKAEEDANKKIEYLQKSEEERAKKIVDEQNRKLLEEEKASVADLEASKAQQKLVDEQNIKNQAIANNVAEQNSAMAFAKLGLSMSSGAIVQAQQITQNGAYAIALMESNVIKNQTALTKDIIEVKNKYTTAVNDNINKYNDLIAKYKEDSINRINSLTLNKLKSSEDILKEKKKTADDFRKTVIDLENQFKLDQKNLADDAVKNAENIRLNSERIKTEKLTKLTDQLTSGELSRMTPDEIVKLEDDLQLPKGTIKAKMNEGISKSLRAELDKIAGTDYFPTNLNDLIAKVKEQMSQGRDLTASLNFVLANDAKTNPNLKNAMQSKVDKSNLDAEKLQLEREKFEFDKGVTSSEFKETYGTDLSGVTVSSGTGNTRADRNNNPGNLRVEGTNGRDSGGFGIFNTPEEGFNAMVKDVSAKVNGGSRYSGQIKNLYDLISVYAPAGDNNNPSSYSNIVAKALGISPTTPISELKGREVELAQAMAKHEGWTGNISKSNKEETTELSNMTSSELRAYAGRNGIQYDDSKNVNTLRANIEGAIKIGEAKSKEAQAESYNKQLNQFRKDIASGNFEPSRIEEALGTDLEKVNELKSLTSGVKSLGDRIIKGMNPLTIGQDLSTKTFGDQSRDLKKITANINALEETLTDFDARTNPEKIKLIREKYIAPLLKKQGIQYDTKKGKFYIDQTIGNIYL